MEKHSRRQFLVGVGSIALARRLSAQGAAQAPHRIDIHQHFVSPSYLATMMARNVTTPVPGLANWKGFSPERTVEGLDRIGVATAMLSVTAPGVWFGDPLQATRLAHELNEYAAAKMVGAFKGRFGLFAVLPIPFVEGSLKEIEYAFDTLKADGVGLLTSYGNQWLGDAAFNPIFEELNRRKAVVYTHPTDAACCPSLIRGVPPQMLEYPTDTTRAIVNLLVGGAASRYPEVRFVFSHAGGTISSIAGRAVPGLSGATLAKPAEPDSRLYHLRRFYYDTAGAANPVNMQALKTLVSTSQIVFGTDSPFFDGAPIVEGLKTCGFTPDELRAVERDNALQLLGRSG